MRKTGHVSRWDAERAFGFIRSADTVADVFFHLRDFQGKEAPRIGMPVVFDEIHVGGKGPRGMAVRPSGAPGNEMHSMAAPHSNGGSLRGRTPRPLHSDQTARQRPAGPSQGGTAPPNGQGRRHAGAAGRSQAPYALAMGTMMLAWVALLAWGVWAQRLSLWAVGVVLGVNMVTLVAYASDKYAARRGQWRTRESHLHLLALAGGWPAAWLAQQKLRHKTQKAAFRMVYGLTVVAHCAALAAWLGGLIG